MHVWVAEWQAGKGEPWHVRMMEKTKREAQDAAKYARIYGDNQYAFGRFRIRKYVPAGSE